MKKLTASARTLWQACSSRERAALVLAVGSLIAAAMYVLLLGPGHAARERLESVLPGLRDQLETMLAQEREITTLRKRLGKTAQRVGLEPMLQSALVGTSFAGSGVRIASLPGERAQLTASAVVFDDWIAWVENLQREFAISLDECRIAAVGQPGMVRVEAAFAPAGQPDRTRAR